MIDILKACLILSSIALIGWGTIQLGDKVLHGVIKAWFYRFFYTDSNYPGEGKLGVLFLSWLEIKQFIIYSFITLFTFIVICMGISMYLYARYRGKRDISFIAEAMKNFMADTDEISLPVKYSEIETQLRKIKTVAQKQQQRMQMEMLQKSDLITYLAHDLKTPLASVIGYLSLLEEAPDMLAEQKAKYTEVALEKAYRLEDLINEFFDITRFNIQSIVLNKGKIKLAFMLQQLADEFYPILTPQGKQMVIQVPDDLILIGDADKLARVFNNIIKNAIAYSYEKSNIEVTASIQEDQVFITFTNQGDPIPAMRLETIFEKFYRLDSARSTNTGGAGLGLAIAQEIVLAHDGIITAESSLEHTNFTVKLPL
jgi:two-component system sensor histidine kinase VanS